MEDSSTLTQPIAIAIVAGMAAQVLANYLKVPSIVFLLAFGVLLGGSGLGWILPQQLDIGLGAFVSLSVALILFEGGLSLKLQDLGKVSASLRNLVTIGPIVTLVGGGLAAHWLVEFPWTLAFLFASLVAVTGPTVINPILKEVGVDRRLATVLEGEGVLIDAIGAVLAVVMLGVVLDNNATAYEIVQGLLFRLGVGGVMGVLGGWLTGTLLKRSPFLSDELKSSVVLAAVLGLYSLAQSLQSESGLMAVVLAGIVLRAAAVSEERMLIRFSSQLTVLTVSVLFVLLSANLSIPSLFALGWGGAGAVLVLMFVVRPVSVAICTAGSNFTWKQKAFLSWCAPRGIVAASVASLFAIVLTQRGVTGGEAVKALVFLTIAMTVVFQGLTAKWVAKLLRLTIADNFGLVIVGGNPLGLLVARLFQSQGYQVAVVDSSAESCKQAAALNIPAFASNGLDMQALAQAGLGSVGTFVALTVNTDVNLVLAQRAMEEFKPPQVFAVYAREIEKEEEPTADVQQAFGNRVPIKAWNQYIAQQETSIGSVTLDLEYDRQLLQFNLLYSSGTLLPILFERKTRLSIVPADVSWESGDRIIFLLHNPKSLESSAVNRRNGWEGISTTLDISTEVIPEIAVPEPKNGLNREGDFREMAREILKKIRPPA